MRPRGESLKRFEVDLNSASQEELEDLPMVGPERARRLVEHRPFESWEEVERVPGFDKGRRCTT